MTLSSLGGFSHFDQPFAYTQAFGSDHSNELPRRGATDQFVPSTLPLPSPRPPPFFPIRKSYFYPRCIHLSRRARSIRSPSTFCPLASGFGDRLRFRTRTKGEIALSHHESAQDGASVQEGFLVVSYRFRACTLLRTYPALRDVSWRGYGMG